MTPVDCMIVHDPANGMYGDCLKACVASLLDLSAGEVPHFANHGVDGEAIEKHLREWLAGRNLAPYLTWLEPIALDELLTWMKEHNPGVHYLLFGQTDDDIQHVVVCLDDAIIHNPAWTGSHIVRADPETGAWLIMTIAVK